jgi:hypothetical protein
MGLLDRVLLLFLLSPMLLVGFGVGMYAFESARQQSTTLKKVPLMLAALAVASLALGLTFFIVTDSDAQWCTKANRDDPDCKLHGGE